MVGIFAKDRVNDDSIAGQAFIDDPRRQRRTLHSLFFASFAGALLAFGHPHKVLRWLDIELLRRFVADDDSFFAAFTADALIKSAGNDLLFPGQSGRQLLSAGMFRSLLSPRCRVPCVSPCIRQNSLGRKPLVPNSATSRRISWLLRRRRCLTSSPSLIHPVEQNPTPRTRWG
jgi:hypothetical protein